MTLHRNFKISVFDCERTRNVFGFTVTCALFSSVINFSTEIEKRQDIVFWCNMNQVGTLRGLFFGIYEVGDSRQ